jgi:hypothetical protein
MDQPSPEVVEALESRARDLSLAIVNPKTLATKLREELVGLVGPEDALAFHLSAAYNKASGQTTFRIAAVTPDFLAKLESGAAGTTLGVSYQKTRGGWTVAVGVEASSSRGPSLSLLEKRLDSEDYQLAASFTVTLRK